MHEIYQESLDRDIKKNETENSKLAKGSYYNIANIAENGTGLTQEQRDKRRKLFERIGELTTRANKNLRVRRENHVYHPTWIGYGEAHDFTKREKRKIAKAHQERADYDQTIMPQIIEQAHKDNDAIILEEAKTRKKLADRETEHVSWLKEKLDDPHPFYQDPTNQLMNRSGVQTHSEKLGRIVEDSHQFALTHQDTLEANARTMMASDEKARAESEAEPESKAA
ncbi:MAG TPA: hypothetical protein VHD84_03260 [Candidatus Saccharimonadales bacterium]|nr:hypothetical protein [Candidatus Saccharimonadales bacterium]